ncbi:hypothetical protein OSTOST_06785 [Ostertagia ostertagi]
MFLFFVAVLHAMVIVGAQDQNWPMPRHLRNVYIEFFDTINRGLVSHFFLFRAGEQREFPHWSRLKLAEKILVTLCGFDQFRYEIGKLPYGAKYGCYHLVARGGEAWFIRILCFFRTTLTP